MPGKYEAEERFANAASKLYKDMKTQVKQPESLTSEQLLRKLVKNGQDVVHYDNHIKLDGSIAWRNNNPGNLRFGDIAERNGSKEKNGGFAVFPSLEHGMNAMRELLQNTYGNMTVSKAIEKYAPPKENDTEKYKKFMKENGIDLDKTVSEQLDEVQKAIIKKEGFNEGHTIDRFWE